MPRDNSTRLAFFRRTRPLRFKKVFPTDAARVGNVLQSANLVELNVGIALRPAFSDPIVVAVALSLNFELDLDCTSHAR